MTPFREISMPQLDSLMTRPTRPIVRSQETRISPVKPSSAASSSIILGSASGASRILTRNAGSGFTSAGSMPESGGGSGRPGSCRMMPPYSSRNLSSSSRLDGVIITSSAMRVNGTSCSAWTTASGRRKVESLAVIVPRYSW